jgi:hypothetical protein
MYFDARGYRVAGIRDIHRLLLCLAPNPQAFVIRGALSEPMRESAKAKREYDRLRRAAGPGKPIDPAVRDDLRHRFKLYRRLLHPQPGSPDTFMAVPRRWFCIDIDGLPLPDGLDVVTDPEAVIGYIRSLLPPELRDVTFVLQLSSSAGFLPGQVRGHLWFWLAEPAGTDRLKRWAASFGERLRLDSAAFEVVQAIYTANPLCEDDVDDPLRGRRVILVEGAREMATLPPDDVVPKSVRQLSDDEDSSTGFGVGDGIARRPNGGGDQCPCGGRTSNAPDTAVFRAPDLDLAEKVLLSTSNDAVTFPHHIDAVRMAAAIRGAFAEDVARGEAAFSAWALRYDGNTEEYLGERWRSVQDRHELGWNYLVRKALEQEGWRRQVRDGLFRDEEEERRLKEWVAIDNAQEPCPLEDPVRALFETAPAVADADPWLERLLAWPADRIRAGAAEIALALARGELSAEAVDAALHGWAWADRIEAAEAFALIADELLRLDDGEGEAKP